MTTRHSLAAFAVVLLAAGPVAARPAVEIPAEVETALKDALSLADARVVPVAFSVPGKSCPIREATVSRPIDGSGRYAVKVVGRGCSAWGWITVEVWTQVAVTTRPLREGEPLEPAITRVDRLVRSGYTPLALGNDPVAAQAIGRGQTLQQNHIRASGGGAGETVKVVVVSGPIAIETSGKMVTCGRGRACAVLASGKHLEGRFSDGRLLVRLP